MMSSKLICLMALLAFLPSPAGAENPAQPPALAPGFPPGLPQAGQGAAPAREVLPEEISDAIHRAEEKAAQEKGRAFRQYIGYSWPYSDRNIASEIGGTPIVLELYTTQGCIFCPSADRFLADLVERVPSIIPLSCHVTYLDVRKGSLSKLFCNDRQKAYAAVLRTRPYMPQLIINGRAETAGFDFVSIHKKMLDAKAAPPVSLLVSQTGTHAYEVVLPAADKLNGQAAEVQIIKYRHPHSLTIADGDNQGMDMTYSRAISSIETVPLTAADSKIVKDIVPAEDEEGAVVMLRDNKGGVLAVADIPLKP